MCSKNTLRTMITQQWPLMVGRILEPTTELNYTITGRKGTVFMHAEYPKLVKKDAEYAAQILVEAKQIYKSLNVGSQLTTIVQENASVSSAANFVLDCKNKEEMGYLTNIGCVLHSYSLLFKYMLKIGPTKNAADTAVLIAKGFKNRTRPRDLVDDKQLALYMKRTPAPLLAETRMRSRLIIVRWVLKNKAALQAAVVGPEWLAEDTDLRDTVLHPDPWLQMEMFPSLLRPLWKIMRRASTDGPGYVKWVYDDILQFQVHVENWAPAQIMKLSASDLKHLHTCVIDRWKFLHQPVYSVAYLAIVSCTPQQIGSVQNCRRISALFCMLLLVLRPLRPCYSFSTIGLSVVTFQILFCGQRKLQRAVGSVGGTSGMVACLSCMMLCFLLPV